MRVHKPSPQRTRSWVLKLAPLVAAILFCAATALGQGRCPYSVAPGETQFLNSATSGDATPFPPSELLNPNQQQGGAYYLDQNKIEAFADFMRGVLAITTSSAFAQINYQFCVSGDPGNPGGSVTATVSTQMEWNGILFSESIAPAPPSADVTLSLLDLGTSGSDAPIVVATQTPLDTKPSTQTIKLISVGGTSISSNGLVPVVLQASVTPGHVYSIQFRLTCHAKSSPLISFGTGCDFGSDLAPVFVAGPYFAKLDSLSVQLGQDLFGILVSIKQNTAGLAAEISATRQAIAAGRLEAEQENAQLLGILNEIKALLTKLQPQAADPPPVPTSGKTKTGDPKPPIRPVRNEHQE